MRAIPPALMNGQDLTFLLMASGSLVEELSLTLEFSTQLRPTTYQKLSLKSYYSHNEHKKQRKWDERIHEVELGLFSPLVFSTTGGCGIISKSVCKRLATLIASKYQKPYNSVINCVCCRLSFASLRSTLLCVRGTRSSLPYSRLEHLIASSDCDYLIPSFLVLSFCCVFLTLCTPYIIHHFLIFFLLYHII